MKTESSVHRTSIRKKHYSNSELRKINPRLADTFVRRNSRLTPRTALLSLRFMTYYRCRGLMPSQIDIPRHVGVPESFEMFSRFAKSLEVALRSNYLDVSPEEFTRRSEIIAPTMDRRRLIRSKFEFPEGRLRGYVSMRFRAGDYNKLTWESDPRDPESGLPVHRGRILGPLVIHSALGVCGIMRYHVLSAVQAGVPRINELSSVMINHRYEWDDYIGPNAT